MHLAQLNIGRLIDDPDADSVAEFMNAIDAINLLGSSSPGFVWILQAEDGPGAVGIRFPGHEEDARLVINLTVWEDMDTMKHFVTRSGHGMYLRRRQEWFEKPTQRGTVLWWIDEGHRPTIEEAAERLAMIRANGPTSDAFDLQTTFPEPGTSG
jgi:hypothetical protein